MGRHGPCALVAPNWCTAAPDTCANPRIPRALTAPHGCATLNLTASTEPVRFLCLPREPPAAGTGVGRGGRKITPELCRRQVPRGAHADGIGHAARYPERGHAHVPGRAGPRSG